MSEIVLAGETALYLYKDIRAGGYSIHAAYLHKNTRIPTSKEIENLKSDKVIKTKVAEVLLADNRAHNACSAAKQYFYTTGRTGIVVRAELNNPFFDDEKVLLVSPSFMLAQLASRYDFLRLFFVALELAGTYATDPDSGSFVSDAKPVLQKRKLQTICNKLKNSRWSGIKKLNFVADFLGENAASPMEAELYVKLALPVSLGGQGIQGLKMNQKVELSSEGVMVSGQPYVKVDFLHPASKVVVEYDSRKFHSSVDQSQRDKRRRDALQRDGYKCFSIVPEQISYCDVFNACIKPVVAAIKGRHRIRNKSFEFKQDELFLFFRRLHSEYNFVDQLEEIYNY